MRKPKKFKTSIQGKWMAMQFILSLSSIAVKSTLLLYQSPTTGLFPTKTCGDDQKAKVHDSLYCAAGAWALALAYR